MKIDTQTYNDIIELLGVIVNDMEEDSREEYISLGCGGDYEDIDTYTIDQEDFDMEKVKNIYKKMLNLRKNKIENIKKEIEKNG